MENCSTLPGHGFVVPTNAVLTRSIAGSFSEMLNGGNISPKLKSLSTSQECNPLAQVT